MSVEPCAVEVSEPPHHFHKHRCQKGATHQFRGVWLCGTHYNQLRRNRRLVLPDRVLRVDVEEQVPQP